MLVTHYLARHNGLEIACSQDLHEVVRFAREQSRRLVTAPPAGTRLLTVTGEHVIYMLVIGPDGGTAHDAGHHIGLLQAPMADAYELAAPVAMCEEVILRHVDHDRLRVLLAAEEDERRRFEAWKAILAGKAPP